MFHKISEFIQEWEREADLTQHVLGRLTDAKLSQPIAEGHNTLGWLGWHLAVSLPAVISTTGSTIVSPGTQDEQRQLPKKLPRLICMSALKLSKRLKMTGPIKT